MVIVVILLLLLLVFYIVTEKGAVVCVCSIIGVKTVKTKGKSEAFVLAHIPFHRLLALSIQRTRARLPCCRVELRLLYVAQVPSAV